MKGLLVALLLFSSFALAACDDKVESTKQQYSSGSYSDEARLAEVYKNVAECFALERNKEQSDFYYMLAGNAYTQAGNNLTQDFNLQAGLFNAAGESYTFAGILPLAVASYNKTVILFREHPNQVDQEKREEASQNIAILTSHDIAPIFNTEPPKPEIGLIYLVLIAVFIIGLIAFVFYRRARR